MSILSKPYFHDTEAAFAKLESILWADGPVCPHCGTVDHAYKIAASTAKRVRHGLWKCGEKECRKQFTVTVGTIFEGSKVPLYKWFQAVFLMVSSKKGISANQMARTLEVTVKTAWFMGHRIHKAMREGGPLDQMDGAGEIVEADETLHRPRLHDEAEAFQEAARLRSQAQSSVPRAAWRQDPQHGRGQP